MSVKIRLRRTGANNDVCYRVVAVDSRSPREGSFLEALGWYDPKREGINFSLHADRISYWQGHGAQLSNTVASLLRRQRLSGAAQPDAAPSGATVPVEEKDVAPPPDATPPDANPPEAEQDVAASPSA